MSAVEFYHPGMAQWIPCSNGTWPSNAVVSGTEGYNKVYVARANFKGAVLPGKLRAGHKACYVPWGGEEHAVLSYEVLVAAPGELHWATSSKGQLVRHAVVGGRSQSGEQLFVGRVPYKGSNIPGKIHPSHKRCFISHGGMEISFDTYQILHG